MNWMMTGGRPGPRSLASLLLVVAVVALLLVWGRDWHRPSTWHDSRLDSPFLNTRPEVRYVGDESCAQCHAKIAASYHQHSMGRSMALAADSPIPGVDGPSGRVEFTAQGLSYAIERRDGRIFHSEEKKDARGRVLTRVEAEVAYAVGSGHRGRSFLIERGGFLMQSPISWYSQQQRWDLSPDSLVKNSHFERPIDKSCLFCHSNRFEPLPGTINAYREPIFQGLTIGCERCHGPGELHLKNPGIGAQGFDPSIVNPKRLEPGPRESVCEQCHLAGRSRIERLGRGVLDYRPGLPLDDFLAVFVDRKPAKGEARSIGHIEQMHVSKCYLASNGKFGCTSCHDPHVLPAAEERSTYYKTRCLNCHGTGAGCSVPEPQRRQKSRDDSCIDCHMPRSSLSNVAHTAETNHSIPRHGDMDTQPPLIAEAKRSMQSPLTATLGPQSDATSTSPEDAKLARELGIALAGFGAEAHNDRAHLSRLAMPLLEEALKQHPDDLVAWQSMVVARTLQGQPKAAIEAAEAALAIAPNDERTLALSLPFVAGEGSPDEAIEVGRRLLEVNPHVSRYHMLMAQLLARKGQWAAAAEACHETLRVDPLNLTARHILILSTLRLGDRPAAEAEAEIYLRMDIDEAERGTVLRWLRTAR